MGKHIGIVAVSPEGSALCYRQIFRSATRLVGDAGHPIVTLHNEPFELYIEAVVRDDWHAVGMLLRRSATVLAQAGADFCIIPDNLMQHAVHLAEVGSPIPWLTMTDLVADAVTADGRKVVGLIGTRMVMLGSTYQTHLGLRGVQVLVPREEEAHLVDSIVFRELVYGVSKPESQRKVLEVIRHLADNGCEGVILGCTEAPLLVTAENSPLPVYDSTSLLAEGAVRRALGLPMVPR
ncbi:MAG: amino acid racemase [Phycisphaeraceae bacterium]|nr:amino acid racemase [Phycisphaeraceae bacterium]